MRSISYLELNSKTCENCMFINRTGKWFIWGTPLTCGATMSFVMFREWNSDMLANSNGGKKKFILHDACVPNYVSYFCRNGVLLIPSCMFKNKIIYLLTALIDLFATFRSS